MLKHGSDDNPLSRREIVKLAALAAAGGAWSTTWASTDTAKHHPRRKRALRLAHLTDIHVQPQRRAAEGFTACLHHVQNQADKPELIITGGDSIMDSLSAGEPRTKTQWQLWQKVLANECSLPIKHCIGNHDVWGWRSKESQTTGEELLYGKKWALQVFGLDKPYYRFDRAGWIIIVLDSSHRGGKDYIAKLDEEQFAWLSATLEEVGSKAPVMLVSHIPILSAAAYFEGENESSGDWVVPGRWMHIDSRRITNLLRKHDNVRLCISGHMHQVDRVEYAGVTYLCSGAVCGSWWKGDHLGFDEGYAIIDLYSDGSFEHVYVPYGWQVTTS